MSQATNNLAPTVKTPEWLAQEYEQGNDGQFQEAIKALSQIGVWDMLPIGKAADIGCGSGRLAAALAQVGWQVDASDVSLSMIEATRERCKGMSVNANVCNAQHLLLEPENYGLITSCWMLHWLKDPAPTLQQIASAVKPNGHVILQWSCGQARSEGFVLRDTIQEVFDQPQWRERLIKAPLTMYQLPLEEVSTFLMNNGFEIVSSRENISIAGGESLPSLKRALRSAAFAAQTAILGDDVDELIDECLALLFARDAMQVANTELIARLK